MSLFAGLVLFGLPLFGQGNSGNATKRVPLPVDWSFSHVVYTRNFTPEQAASMQNDPRLYNSWLLQGHAQFNNGGLDASGFFFEAALFRHLQYLIAVGENAGGAADDVCNGVGVGLPKVG